MERTLRPYNQLWSLIMKILRLPEVMTTTGLGRSSVYAFVAQNTFPRPIRLGERAVGWKSDEVNTWIEQRAELRGGAHVSR